MTGFLLPAALLVVLAVCFAISALWNTERRLAIGLAVALPVAAIALYAWRGTPAAIDAPPAPEAATAQAPADGEAPTTVAELVADIEAKLKADPKWWQGWAVLGRVRLEQGDAKAAVEDFAKAHALVPDDDVVAVSYAEALKVASPDQRYPAQAVALLERSVASETPDERALFHLGVHRMLTGRPGDAADLWDRLLPRLDPQMQASLKPQIAAARAAAGQAPSAPTPDEGAGPALVVTISLDPKQPAPEGPTALFVFARPVAGGPPVAARRLLVETFPVQVTLGDADRPMPTNKLSDHGEVVVTARLSRSGNAMGDAGDIESAPKTVKVVDGAPVALALDRVRP